MFRHHPSILHRASILTLLALGLLTACGGRDAARADSPAPPETWFPVTIGAATLEVQIALSAPEQQRGLMYRDSLGAGQGMVFLFPAPRAQSFWMKNTRIPLDIGFFDSSGTLLEIHTLYPYDETPVLSASSRVQIAIETNRGWFRANGVRPGDRLDLADLAEAVDRRGGDIASYRLSRDPL